MLFSSYIHSLLRTLICQFCKNTHTNEYCIFDISRYVGVIARALGRVPRKAELRRFLKEVWIFILFMNIF